MESLKLLTLKKLISIIVKEYREYLTSFLLESSLNNNIQIQDGVAKEIHDIYAEHYELEKRRNRRLPKKYIGIYNIALLQIKVFTFNDIEISDLYQYLWNLLSENDKKFYVNEYWVKDRNIYNVINKRYDFIDRL
jgi:hypothetical protein